MTRLLTAREVAEALRVSASTVYAMSERGELRTVVVRRGTERSIRRFRAEDIEAFIKESLEED